MPPCDLISVALERLLQRSLPAHWAGKPCRAPQQLGQAWCCGLLWPCLALVRAVCYEGTFMSQHSCHHIELQGPPHHPSSRLHRCPAWQPPFDGGTPCVLTATGTRYSRARGSSRDLIPAAWSCPNPRSNSSVGTPCSDVISYVLFNWGLSLLLALGHGIWEWQTCALQTDFVIPWKRLLEKFAFTNLMWIGVIANNAHSVPASLFHS